MKKTIKPILMLLLMSVSYFLKGQPFLPSHYTAAGSSQQLIDNQTNLPTLFNLANLGDPSIGSFIEKIIAGDPNGVTGTTSNLGDMSICGIDYKPFQLSMIQAYGGEVTGEGNSRYSIASMIKQNGIGYSFGALSDASYPNGSWAFSTGVHGENNFVGTFNNPGLITTAGGYFRNNLSANAQSAPFANQINAGVIGHIKGGGIGNTAVLGLDETDIPSPGVGLNYAGVFLGRGYFSNRVGIGPATSGLISNPAQPSHMLHIDGTSSPSQRVLRLVNLDEADNTFDDALVIDYRTVSNGTVDWGNVKFRKLNLPNFCTSPANNVNHTDASGNFICGRIWDNATSTTATTGNVGINTFLPTAPAIVPAPHLWTNLATPYTGTKGTVRIDGRLQLNDIRVIDPLPNPMEILAIMPSTAGATTNEVVRIPYPTGPIPSCSWQTIGNNDVTAVARGTIALSPLCSITSGGPRHNFIGTTNALPNTDAADLVFGTRNNGWMRLTTDGGLFLTDLAATSANQTTAGGSNANSNNFWGNIKIGLYAGYNSNPNPAFPNKDNILLGHNSGYNLGTLTGFGASSNIFIGENAGYNVTNNPYGHIFIGQNAGYNCTSTTSNGTLYSNLIIGNYDYTASTPAPNLNGRKNTFIGHQSGAATTGSANTGTANTFIGHSAGSANTTGSANTFVGVSSGSPFPITGQANTVIGVQSNNIAAQIGFTSSTNIQPGSHNTIIGFSNNFTPGNGTGIRNTIVGSRENALTPLVFSDNILIGDAAGAAANDRNIIIGNSAGGNATMENTIVGNGSSVATTTGRRNVILGNLVSIHSPSGGDLSGSVAIGSNFRVRDGNNNIAIMAGGNQNYPDLSSTNGNGYIRIGREIFSSPPPASPPALPSTYDLLIPYIGNDAVVIGTHTKQPLYASINSVNIGINANTNCPSAISIGNNASCGNSGFTPIGANNIAIGTNAFVAQNGLNTNCVAIGSSAVVNQANRMSIGAGAPALTFNTPANFSGVPLNVGIGIQDATTRLHVNCFDQLTNPLPLNRSAVRFQGLQPAPDCQSSPPPSNRQIFNLIIDNEGYVYQGTTALCTNGAVTGARMNEETNSVKTDSLQKAVADQQKQIDDLKAIIAEMSKDVDKCCAKTTGNAVEDFPMSKNITLYQNVPNPFTIGTDIKFFIPETVKQAALVIYDLNGREIRKIDINERNESVIKIQGKELAAGMYIYTLIADNKEVDSKRMILTGN